MQSFSELREAEQVMIASLGCVALGVTLLMALRITARFGRDLLDEVPQLFLRVVGWVFVVTGGLGCAFATSISFGLLFACATGIVALLIANRVNAARQSELLGLMNVAIERDMPLVSALDAYAAETGIRFGRRVELLAARLKRGMPLAEALEARPRTLSKSVCFAARVGGETGTLGRTMRGWAANRAMFQPLMHSSLAKLYYLVMLVLMFLAIGTYMLIEIVPAMEKIFSDFELDLPDVTKLVLDVSEIFYSFAYFPVSVTIVGGLLLTTAVFTELISPRRLVPPPLLRRLDTTAVLRLLAMVIDVGRSMSEGLASFVIAYPHGSVRRRLRKVVEDIETGCDWCESLQRWKLIRPAEAAVLKSAERAGNLAWALEEMADGSQRRFIYRVQTLTQLLFPTVILAFGVVVFAFVFGMFYPLVILIESLTY